MAWAEAYPEDERMDLDWNRASADARNANPAMWDA
jgi:hypothetical protein